MIRLGIVGANYGLSVQLPAFRPMHAAMCTARRQRRRAHRRAAAAGIAKAYGDWRALVDDRDIHAVSVAVPRLAGRHRIAALALGKAVFAEKPMAATLAGARAMLRAARRRAGCRR